MGQALEVLNGRVTAPGATLTAWTMAAGDSLTVRDADKTKRTLLLNAWARNTVDGTLSIRSPKMHDNTDGIQARINAAAVDALLPFGVPQRIYPNDVLSVRQSGSAVAAAIESGTLLVYYEDLSGVSSAMIGPDELKKRAVHLMHARQALVAGVAGGYSGEQAVNADNDQWKADKKYALLGGYCDSEMACIGIRGSDSGNLRVGFPGNAVLQHLTGAWFKRLAEEYDLPLIPVFSSNNKGAILVDIVNDNVALSPEVTLIFAELG